MIRWVVEWIDEWDITNRKDFSTESEATKFANEVFEFYPCRIFKESLW